MDPLTHTLVGANLASTRLGEKTRLATAAFVIGANLPDVDAILYFTGHDDLALGFRRGWTHGILAIFVLPVLLTALLLLYDRLRPDPQRRVHHGWLLAFSFAAVLTHPTLDWLNNYGMRWLMPFRGTWTYGDSVYIMDPFLWLVLGCGWLAQRRSTWRLVALWAFFSGAVAWVVAGRSSTYLIVVAIVAAALLAVLLLPIRRSFAAPALLIAVVYIGARLVIHERTEKVVRRELGGGRVERLMVSPHPMNPTRWDFVAQTGDVYRYGRYSWAGRKLTLSQPAIPVAVPSPEWEAARRDPSIQGFLTWVRFPWYEVERTAGGTIVWVRDARYMTRRGSSGGFGGVPVRIE